MKKAKTRKPARKKTSQKSQSSSGKRLTGIPILNCSFIVPTEDKKGVYLIVDEKAREAVYQVDGLGSDYCRGIDGSRSSEEIAEELIEKHDLPSNEFKEYLLALQKDLQSNGLLSFQKN